jgi:hypothetical protein
MSFVVDPPTMLAVGTVSALVFSRTRKKKG